MKADKRGIYIFSIIVVALILITIFSLRNINRFNDDSKWLAHTREVSKTLSDNFSTIQDVETGYRGFVITGKENYLEPYYIAVKQLRRKMGHLWNLTRDNPVQQKRMDSLEQITKLKLDFGKEIIEIRRQNGFEAAMEVISSEKGKKLMDQIRGIVSRMRIEEERLMQDRIDATNKSLASTRILIIAGGIFSIIVVIGLMFFIKRATKLEKELIKSKEHAEALVGFKDQFLASMSHEIRTPLNGIIGFTRILLRNETIAKQKPHLDAIKTSSDILLVLINDILDLAKIEAGKMDIESTELKLNELVNSILGTFELRFQEKDFKIKKQYDERIPKIVLGDPVRINQILLNLISNSVKFTEKNGQISIVVNLREENKDRVIVELIVSDTGIGIPSEKLKTIFEPFTQSGSDIARRYGGTGLGLSIVKRLVDLMGGTISVKSTLKEGSTFTIALPFTKTLATEISKEIEIKGYAQKLKQLAKLKVLLVEDIPINQFLAQTILHDFGFEADTAENGKIAIELLEKNEYDIILMDLMMPEMNGFEATQYIRNVMKSPKSNTPIIALTADVTKADVDRCLAVGMNEYVSKPINETDLLNKIIRFVKKAQCVEEEIPEGSAI